MAISGRFEADFASFYEACRQAQVSLKGFENSNKDAEAAVNEMVDSFSGRRVVSEATVMADAVGKIGGPARLTQAELRRVGQVADEAIEKMNRWGEAPPRNLLRLSEAAKQTRSGLSQAAGQIREVDNVLDVFGIHLGPARKAIDDLGYAAENGADKLGVIGSAGLALGAAIGGWQIGRAISEFAGLDEKIGKVAASLLGLPSVAEQAAAATADAIARAQKAHPELAVKTGETAQLLNQLDAQDKVAANKAASDIADRVNAIARVQAEIKKVMDEVDSIRRSGVWDDLTRQINTHAVSLSELAKQYHVSDEAMNLLAQDAAKIASVSENNSKKLEQVRQQFQTIEADRQRKEEERVKAMYAGIDAQWAAAEAQHQKDIEAAEAQAEAIKRTKAQTKALEEQAEAARKVAEAMVFTREYDLSTKGGLDEFKRLNPNASVAAGATPDYFKTHSLADAVRDGLVQFYSGQLGPNSRGLTPPGYAPPGAAGGAGGAGGAAPAPLPPLPGAGAPVEPGSASRAGGGITVYAPVIVSGVFDPSSAAALGTTVSGSIWNRLSKGRNMRWRS